MRLFIYFIISAILFVSTGCSKLDDEDFPIIQVLGPNPIVTTINKPFVDTYGIYTYDNSEIIEEWSNFNSLNINRLGTYNIYYGVIDDDENETIAEREVRVIADGFSFEGVWEVSLFDTIGGDISKVFVDSITAPSENSFFINRLNGCDFSQIFALVSGEFGQNITIHSQIANSYGSPIEISGFGEVNQSADRIIFTYEYTFLRGIRKTQAIYKRR